MQRFFVEPTSLRGDEIIINDAKQVEQMRRVLRMRPGDSFIVLDNTGVEYFCDFSGFEGRNARGVIRDKKINAAETNLKVTLYQALPKKLELFEWVLQKGTEIGVSQFVPIITQRTERSSLPKPERLHAILKEAAEQSGRGILPELCDVSSLEEAISSSMAESKIMLHTDGPTSLLSDLKGNISKNSVALFVGPEGGFSEAEAQSVGKKGVALASLGPRTLRTETAGIAGASLLLL